MDFRYNSIRFVCALIPALFVLENKPVYAQQPDPSRGDYCSCLRTETSSDSVRLRHRDNWEKCRRELPNHVDDRSSSRCQRLAGYTPQDQPGSGGNGVNGGPIATTRLDDGFNRVGGVRTDSGLSHEFGVKSPASEALSGADGYIRVRYDVSYDATPNSAAESRTLWSNIVRAFSRATTQVNDRFALVLVATTSHEGKTKLLATAPIFEFKHTVGGVETNTFDINAGGAFLSPTLKSDNQVKLEFKLVRANDRQLSILFGRNDVQDGDTDLTGVDVIDAIVSKTDIVAVSQTITKNFGPAFEVLTQNEVANINVSRTLDWAENGTSAIQTVLFDKNRSDLLNIKVTVNLEFSESRISNKMDEFVDGNRTIRYPKITGEISSENLLNKFKVYDSENDKILEIDDYLAQRHSGLMSSWGRQSATIVTECKSINAVIADFAVPVDQRTLFGALLTTKSQDLLVNWDQGCLRCREWKIMETTGIDLSEFSKPECDDGEMPAPVVVNIETLNDAISFWADIFPSDPATIRPALFRVGKLSLAKSVAYSDPDGILFFQAEGDVNSLGEDAIRSLLQTSYRKKVEHFGCHVRLDKPTISEKSNTVHALIKHADFDQPNQITFIFEGSPKDRGNPLILGLALKKEPDQNVLKDMKNKHTRGCGKNRWKAWQTLIK